MTLEELGAELLREARRQIADASEEAFHDYAERLEADLALCVADLEVEPFRVRPIARAARLH